MENTGKSGGGYASRLPHRKYSYFRDDQIVQLVSHDEPVIPMEALNANIESLSASLKKTKADAVVSPDPQVITLPGLSEDADESARTSMITALVYPIENAPKDPLYLTEVVNDFNSQSKNRSISGLTEIGASPNWLTSITARSGGTGGPGGKPSPFYGNRLTAPYRFDYLIKSLQDQDKYGAGSGVDVAILDTAPCAHDLIAAHKEWSDHPIIATLLGPGGKLHLYPATYDELLRLDSTSLNDHDYRMTDHGLFIAGIIHSIVPEAEIHLIEVLNHYGVGDLVSFARGLEQVHRSIYNPARKLVINCSWMLEFPRADLHARHLNLTDPDALFEKQVRDFCDNDENLKTTAHMLETLFDNFVAVNRRAIAAAGNDGREGDTGRSKARYPAALESVQGVGALPTSLEQKNGKYRPSIYSNLADEPSTSGIMTLGGEEGEGKGVLGVYLGEFPNGQRNVSKWASWCGTSFATAIVTGATASVLSSPNGPRSTPEAIATLANLMTQPDATKEHERVLAVKQS